MWCRLKQMLFLCVVFGASAQPLRANCYSLLCPQIIGTIASLSCDAVCLDRLSKLETNELSKESAKMVEVALNATIVNICCQSFFIVTAILDCAQRPMPRVAFALSKLSITLSVFAQWLPLYLMMHVDHFFNTTQIEDDSDLDLVLQLIEYSFISRAMTAVCSFVNLCCCRKGSQDLVGV